MVTSTLGACVVTENADCYAALCPTFIVWLYTLAPVLPAQTHAHTRSSKNPPTDCFAGHHPPFIHLQGAKLEVIGGVERLYYRIASVR